MSGKRRALIVGVSAYADPAIRGLPLAEADASAMEELLVRLGYEVRLLRSGAGRKEDEPTRAQVEAALGALCDGAAEEDLLLCYVACHGVRVGDQAMLALCDAVLDRLAETGLPVSAIEARLRGSAVKKRVVLLDACHSGVDVGRDISRATDEDFLEQVHARAQGFAILAASTAGQKAQEAEAEAGHGLFTHFVMKGLDGEADRTSRGFVTVADLWSYVTANVSAYTAAHRVLTQDPTARVEGQGDIPLTDGKAEPPRWKSRVGPPRDAYPTRRFSPFAPMEGPPEDPQEERALQCVSAASLDGAVHLCCARRRIGDALCAVWHRCWQAGEWSAWTRLENVRVRGALVLSVEGPLLSLLCDGPKDGLYYCRFSPLAAPAAPVPVMEKAAIPGGMVPFPAAPEPEATARTLALAGGPEGKLLVMEGWLLPAVDPIADLSAADLRELDAAMEELGGDLRPDMWNDTWTPDTLDLDGKIRMEGTPAIGPFPGSDFGVFCRGTGGHIWLMLCRSLEKTEWEMSGTDLGGPDLFGPTVSSRGPGHLDLFARDGAGRLWQRTYYLGPGWSAWVPHEDVIAIASGPVAAAPNGGELVIFALSKDGVLHGKRWPG